ncbi:pectate lyase family protein [Catenovulum sediminis]|uniref:Pectate lyase n=1 Tax=Catenovulum sediminis TaxID=1740262 RepID=A0ABV1RKL0_9ALTE|nr:hypothetical protein [Catenovulum sediminis]
MRNISTINKGLFICLLLSISTWSLSQESRLAFPEAKGFGRYTQGGYGGQVYVVDSLADYTKTPIKGTLRYAVESKGPRIVVFNVSGVIQLKKPLKFNNPYITVAGQTSPGGIVIAGQTTGLSTDQVIIRYLRFRLGHSVADEDAFSARNVNHVIIDHCSFSWGVDETASFYNNRYFTLQYSIISESLNDAGHKKGQHGYGGIWGGSGASFANNVIAHHTSRTPRINGYRLKPQFAQSEAYVELVNNVIYNWQNKSAYGGENARFNLLNNYFKLGPAAGPERIFEFFPVKDGVNKTQAYIEGNYFFGAEKITNNNLRGLKFSSKMSKDEPLSIIQDNPVKTALATHNGFYYPTIAATDAYVNLIVNKEIGANRNFTGVFVDSVDNRILREIANGSAGKGNKGIIDTELDVINNWPEYEKQFTQFSAYQDKNKDGIADTWMAEFSGNLIKGVPPVQQYIDYLGAF